MRLEASEKSKKQIVNELLRLDSQQEEMQKQGLRRLGELERKGSQKLSILEDKAKARLEEIEREKEQEKMTDCEKNESRITKDAKF
eukprot:TRINITY_DN1707_c0_g1_i1.p1 TRINITY_DN1707_c0_g1~~TRINITY_DN1707_c0_g1_i1.p1  ORF type:complete len:99 (-),score=28.79 TRINITY_DN1707_c0_g1_i1:96-353(-)